MLKDMTEKDLLQMVQRQLDELVKKRAQIQVEIESLDKQIRDRQVFLEIVEDILPSQGAASGDNGASPPPFRTLADYIADILRESVPRSLSAKQIAQRLKDTDYRTSRTDAALHEIVAQELQRQVNLRKAGKLNRGIRRMRPGRYSVVSENTTS